MNASHVIKRLNHMVIAGAALVAGTTFQSCGTDLGAYDLSLYGPDGFDYGLYSGYVPYDYSVIQSANDYRQSVFDSSNDAWDAYIRE